MYGWMDVWMDGWMDRWMHPDGCIRMDGWMDRWMHACMHVCMYGPVSRVPELGGPYHWGGGEGSGVRTHIYIYTQYIWRLYIDSIYGY